MKKKFLSLAIMLISLGSAFGGVIILEGKYQDKNLFVQNGFAANGVGFCTYEVTINGNVSTDEINSSAFEIDFTAFQIKPGTSVTIEIKHKDGCMPKVLNPEVLKPKPTFEIINININKSGLLSWSTKNEMGSIPYIVEQFRWNKWIPVAEIQGTGKMDKNNYSFQTSGHSGENKFRVKQIGVGEASKMSNAVTFLSTIGKPSYLINRSSGDIEFSEETMYEVYDAYGILTKRGYGKDLKVNNLEKGNYYLCYDNTMTDFKKK